MVCLGSSYSLPSLCLIATLHGSFSAHQQTSDQSVPSLLFHSVILSARYQTNQEHPKEIMGLEEARLNCGMVYPILRAFWSCLVLLFRGPALCTMLTAPQVFNKHSADHQKTSKKSKLPWGNTAHQSEGPSLKNLQITNAEEGALYPAGGNVSWCSPYEKQDGVPQRTKT